MPPISSVLPGVDPEEGDAAQIGEHQAGFAALVAARTPRGPPETAASASEADRKIRRISGPPGRAVRQTRGPFWNTKRRRDVKIADRTGLHDAQSAV